MKIYSNKSFGFDDTKKTFTFQTKGCKTLEDVMHNNKHVTFSLGFLVYLDFQLSKHLSFKLIT